MAQLEYKHASRTLSWSGKGRWDAVSGPRSKLPNGIYKIGRREVSAYTNKIGKAFQGANGKGFFIPIYADFPTTRGKSGGRLGIHPDGNKPGTAGCIGLKSNSKAFYDAIASVAPNASLTLEVFD